MPELFFPNAQNLLNSIIMSRFLKKFDEYKLIKQTKSYIDKYPLRSRSTSLILNPEFYNSCFEINLFKFFFQQF